MHAVYVYFAHTKVEGNDQAVTFTLLKIITDQTVSLQ